MNDARRPSLYRISGAVCLDFVNTAKWGRRGPTQDRLSSYDALVQWAGQLGVVAEEGWLLDRARQLASEAAGVHRAALELRTTAREVFTAVARGEQPAAVSLRALNGAIAAALGRLRVSPRPGGFVWAWADPDESLERPLWPVAWSAAQLLTSDRLVRLRSCASSDCGWLFLDESRRGNRRWCDMRMCGNREKARRHYRRLQDRTRHAAPHTAAG